MSKRNNATFWIDRLQLERHPEGGWYKRTYAGMPIETERGERPSATLIYYLLESGDFSTWHMLQSDEIWFFHEGSPLHLHVFELGEKRYSSTQVGGLADGGLPQVLIPAHSVFGAELIQEGFALISCMVSPGFHFDDFSFYPVESLVANFPEQVDVIQKLNRP